MSCAALRTVRSFPRRVEKGNEAFANSVGQACVAIIEHYVARGAVGILENPAQALPKRPWMRKYDRLKQVVDYCMSSGPRPADFDGSRPCQQKLEDWFPARKPTAIYVLGGPTEWLPSRTRCRRLKGDCGFCDERGGHIAWSERCGKKQRVEICRARGFPHVYSRQELHRIPSILTTELLNHAAVSVARRTAEREMKDAGVPGMQGEAA